MLAGFPVYHSAFLGRTSELEAVRALLEQHRWVTITGPGGVGKTRFAIELSAHLEMPRFVDASLLSSSAALMKAIAQIFGWQHEDARALAVQLAGHGDEPVWLVLDNLEHLLPDVTGQLEVLHANCPRLHLLCTSIAPLGSPDEQRFWLPPFVVREDASNDAMQLFVTGARVRRPDWQPSDQERRLIRDICAALDGLPLAIELVAVRSHALPLATMVTRLQQDSLPTLDPNREARHMSLEAVIGWSVHLLEGNERRCLEAIAWLEGGFDLGFASRLLEPLGLTLPALLGLVEKALVVREGERFRLLSPIRSHLRHRWQPTPEFYEAYTKAIEPMILEPFAAGVRGAVTAEMMQRFQVLQPDWRHVQAVVGWNLEQARLELPWAVLDRLTTVLLAKSYGSTLPAWFETLLEHPQLEAQRRLRLFVLYGITLADLNDPRVLEINQRGQALAAELGDEARQLAFGMNLASYLAYQGEFEASANHYEAALEVAERTERRDALQNILGNLGYIRLQQGKYREALGDVTRALALTDPTEVADLGVNHGLLSLIHTFLGEPTLALEHAKRSIDISREFDLQDALVGDLLNLAHLAVQLEQIPLGSALFEAAAATAEREGIPQYEDTALDAPILAARSRLEPAILEESRQRGRRTAPKTLLQEALAVLEGLVVPRAQLEFNLSPRERDILKQLVMGVSNDQIATSLGLTRATVRNRLSEVYGKLGVKTRTEAIRVAVERGLD
jgi:DNA-binding CsgD family transcriptional regulator